MWAFGLFCKEVNRSFFGLMATGKILQVEFNNLFSY